MCEWIDVTFSDRGTVSIAIDQSKLNNLASYSLEPELLTTDASLKTGQQQMLTYPEIPQVMVQAILAIEDRRFFQHSGNSMRGISRAFINWASSGSIKFQQGGSDDHTTTRKEYLPDARENAASQVQRGHAGISA